MGDVAVKVIRPELAAGLGIDRFLREIRIGAGLQHPHIVGLIDSGAVDSSSSGGPPAVAIPYYVMPYIAGESLRDLLRRERQLPLEDALRIIHQVGDALSYAHARGVVHRDVKPGNILLADGHAWVADFGLARAITVAADEQLTETGLVVGTPTYMSPEQASGDAMVDGRSDVYALGCVLYEMLAGEPLFGGRTAQAILARHRSEPPPSVRVVRPGVPAHVEAALYRALAKVAADRFRTIADFLTALDTPETPTEEQRAPLLQRRSVRLGATVLAVLAAAAGLGYAIRGQLAPLEANRVVVFPLDERPSAAQGEGGGEAVATYLGYALDGTAPLRWLDGWDFLDQQQRARPGLLTMGDARTIARTHRARFFIDGSIVRGADSVTIVLRLHDVQGDSLVRRTGASALAGTGSLPQLGLRAMSELLPALLEPGRRIDLTPLSERRPAAIAGFLRGEREYRRLHFDRALAEYRSAVGKDSAFALAALKGGMTADWLKQPSTDAQDLLAIAFRQRTLLPHKYRLLAEGLSLYHGGSADSSLARFRGAVAEDPGWTEAWMSIGEVYYHLLPRGVSLDSLAEASFLEVLRFEPDFTPALYHLVTISLRRGKPQAARAYLQSLRTSGADSLLQLRLGLMFDCLDHGPNGVDWVGAARHDPGDVLEAAQPLIADSRQRACARAAHEAVLGGSAVESRWGALLGLQGLLVAEGRYDELELLSVLAGCRPSRPTPVPVGCDGRPGTGPDSSGNRSGARRQLRRDGRSQSLALGAVGVSSRQHHRGAANQRSPGFPSGLGRTSGLLVGQNHGRPCRQACGRHRPSHRAIDRARSDGTRSGPPLATRGRPWRANG